MVTGLVLLQAAIDIPGLISGWNADWMPITFVSLLLSMFVVVIAYMIAEFMRSPQLNAWAKNELYETLLSAFLVANLVVGLALMNTAIGMFVGGGAIPGCTSARHICMAQAYFDTLVSPPNWAVWEFINWNKGSAERNDILDSLHDDRSTQLFGDVLNGYLILMIGDFGLGSFVELSASVSLPIMPGFTAISFGFMPFIGLMPLLNGLVMVTDFVGMVIIAIYAQQAFLKFSEEQMFAFFLPLGIVLRAFPITRRLGSTIIALAITCYVIYPLTLVMNLQIYGAMQLSRPPLITDTDALPAELRNLGEGNFKEIIGVENLDDPVAKPTTDFWSHLYKGDCIPLLDKCWYAKLWYNIKTIGQTVLPLVWQVLKFAFLSFFDPEKLVNYFVDIVAWAARASLIVAALFLTDLIICVTFFRSISTSLGGEAQIMGLAKVL
ncbi:MAG: hypothetical protein NT157_01865 [Candidatus Micrarchaeota archaeon]|nr:hypothetical protein [Candidatus Micrarchaeota archaeon]